MKGLNKSVITGMLTFCDQGEANTFRHIVFSYHLGCLQEAVAVITGEWQWRRPVDR